MSRRGGPARGAGPIVGPRDPRPSPGLDVAPMDAAGVVDEDAPQGPARHERLWLGGLAVGGVLGLWEVVSRAGVVEPIFLSSPTRIAVVGWAMLASGELLVHLRVSGLEFLLGYGLAVATGLPIGLAAGWYPRLGFTLDPFLSALYATPRVALLPLIILWVGIGIWSTVAVVSLGAFFPICLTTMAGVRTVDHLHVRLAQSFQAGAAQIFRTIVLPSCVPFMLAGLRLGVGRALVGVVVGELFGASAGIGFLITVAGSTFQTDKVFVGIAILAGFGVLCNELLSRAERRVERWRPRSAASP